MDYTISEAEYVKNFEETRVGTFVTINGQKMSVPLDPANSHYAEILRQVEAGTLTIQDAE